MADKKRGAPRKPEGIKKIGICIRLDPELVLWLKRQGGSRSRLVNTLVRTAMLVDKRNREFMGAGE